MIEFVVIACYRLDQRFLRACVASVRCCDPDIPVYLIKDYTRGAFSTREIERSHGVQIWPGSGARFKWGLSKLELLFPPERRRFLVLDAATILLPGAWKWLGETTEDFVVHGVPWEPEVPSWRNQYFDWPAVQAYDPGLKPGPVFNSGHLIASSGLITRGDFADLIDWHERAVRRDLFPSGGGQGPLNYMLLKAEQQGRLTVGRGNFARLPFYENKPALGPDEEEPAILHWAGLKDFRIGAMPDGPLWLTFEDRYYKRVRLAAAKRLLRTVTEYPFHRRKWSRALYQTARDLRYKLLRTFRR